MMIEELSKPLDQRIGAAMARGDWAAAETLSKDLAGEYGNAGILGMLKAMLDEAEKLAVADQAQSAERIGVAIASRDAAEAGRLLALKRERHSALHHLHIESMAQLMDALVRLWGESGLETVLRRAGEANRAAMFDALADLPMPIQIKAWAKSLRNHLGEIEVTEDDEKYTIRQDPCGSGGRLMRAGKFDGEDGLRRVSAKELTLGAEDLPSYCSHCPVWMANQHAEWYGKPGWVLSPPGNNSAPCTIHFYKDAAQIPTQYRERLSPSSQNPNSPKPRQ